MRTPTTYRGSAGESGERFAGPVHAGAAASSAHGGGEDAHDERDPAAPRTRRDADPDRTHHRFPRSTRFGDDGGRFLQLHTEQDLLHPVARWTAAGQAVDPVRGTPLR